VRACVRACGYPVVWACACAYVHIALLVQQASRMSHIVTSFVAPLAPPYFSTLSHQQCNFRKKVIEQKNLFSDLLISHSEEEFSEISSKMSEHLHFKYSLFLSDFNEN
jgi:hypothetical protein